MRIEKINENKIRIFLNLEDLRQKNIDVHSFMSNPIESQTLFLDVLKLAEEEIGFSTKDCKLSIEAVAMSYGDFILTVTRDRETTPKRKKHFEAKRKTDNTSQDFSVFAFENFDDFIKFCGCFKNSRLANFKKYMKASQIYELNSTYYLVFITPTPNLNELKSLYGFLSEFSKPVFDSDLFVRKLQEYGTLIINRDPINTINKNFAS